MMYAMRRGRILMLTDMKDRLEDDQLIALVSGREAGVYLNGERRWLPVLGPGGVYWLPQAGEAVLVLKTGADGESPCVLARQQQAEADHGAETVRPEAAHV